MLLAGIICCLAWPVPADDMKAAAPKPYPLNTCLVCDMKFDGMSTPDVFVYQGQEIKVCDKSEEAEFDKAPDKYLKKLADAEAKLKADSQAAAPKPYPLSTCLVCDMQLGGMGTPYVFVYQGQEIEVCDKSEEAEFDKTPDKYLKKLADAVAKLNK